MEFHHFRDEYWSVRDQNRLKPYWRSEGYIGDLPTAHQFYEHTKRNAGKAENIRLYGSSCLTQVILGNALQDWYGGGKPYVKVYPAMAAMLASTKLDVAGRFLKVPHKAFEIRLPRQNNPFAASNDTPEVRSVFVILDEAPEALRDQATSKQLCIWFDMGDSEYEPEIDYYQPTHGYIHLQLDDNESIQYVMDHSQERDFAFRQLNAAGQITKPSKQFYNAMLALAVSTAFFLEGGHELILPDIPTRMIERHQRAEKTGGSELKTVLKLARKAGFWGKTLGREIELPRPIVVDSGDREINSSSSFAHRFSHVRSGHLRLQPYGKKDNPQYRIQFIEPTVVRSDLPMRPERGYVIRDSILNRTHDVLESA